MLLGKYVYFSIDSYGDTPVCEAAYPTWGHREPDSLCVALKMSFKKHLENPYNAVPYPCDGQESLACHSPWGLKESDTTE